MTARPHRKSPRPAAATPGRLHRILALLRPAVLLTAAAAVICVACSSSVATAAEWPGRKSQWHGFERYDFEVDGRACYVVVPKEPAPGNPWVWRARFPGYHDEIDRELVKRGFHLAHMNTGGLLGSPQALANWDAFYTALTDEHGLAERMALEGVSRGGLFVYRWAARHPERVACIYADTPVCDFKSWPGGRGQGVGSPPTWQQLLKAYEISEAEALAWDKNPIDLLAPLAEANVPLLSIVSENDQVVPPDENTHVLARRYRELDGSIDVISVAEGTAKTKGHHFPLTPRHIEQAVEFVVEHASLPAPAGAK